MTSGAAAPKAPFMREALLDKLAEPGTGAALRLEDGKTEGGRIVSGRLVSEQTGRSFRIHEGIPYFVEGDTYADSFGLQWNKFREVQVDSDTGAARSRQRFEQETRWDEGTLTGKWVLDAGCGAGRFAEIAASKGANVVALDYSSAVHAAARTLARFPNADVVRGNLIEPPFKRGVFDFAYCIGVVQHTPDPPRVVGNVVETVKPGGEFSFSIYARKLWSKLNSKYLIRPLTKRMPQATLLRAIETVMPVAFPITDRVFRIPVFGRLAQFTVPIANYVDNQEFSREQRYREAVLDTFDMLSPQYDSPMTWREVDQVLKRVGVREAKYQTRVPINVVGVR